MPHLTQLAALIGIAIALVANPARAQQAPAPDPLPLAGALTDQALDAEVVVLPSQLTVGSSTQTLTATNSGNTVNGDTIENGDINVATDAFNGFSGIGNFVMNTGNNSNLQGSVSVVVVMTPQ